MSRPRTPCPLTPSMRVVAAVLAKTTAMPTAMALTADHRCLHATTEGSARHSEDPTPLPPRVSHTGRQTLWRSRLFVPSMSAQAVTMRTRRRQDLSRTEADPSTLHMQETTSRSAPERTDTTCACPSMRPWDPQTLGIPERRCMCAERHTRNYDASCCTWFQMTDRSASQENTGLDSARFSPSRE